MRETREPRGRMRFCEDLGLWGIERFGIFVTDPLILNAATSEQKSFIAENDELISIFVVSINTATHNEGKT